MPAPRFPVPLTFIECPACQFPKAVEACRKVSRAYFFCPICQHEWDLPVNVAVSGDASMKPVDEIADRLGSIRILCQVLGPMSQTSDRYRVLAGDLHAAATAYLAVVEAQHAARVEDMKRARSLESKSEHGLRLVGGPTEPEPA
jgi:hypothetical protein